MINDNGGTKTAADFSFTVNGGNPTPFEADGQNDLTVNAGGYSVTEPAAAGYTTSYDNCSELRLANGATATCTITNDDQPAKLIVKKIVINDNGGTKTAADFTLAVNADSATPASFAGSSNGVPVSLHPGGYSVSETGGADGYTASLSSDCAGTIALGETKTCVVTNDDVAAPPPPVLPTPPVTPVPPAPQIDLAITKRDRPDPATVGERITYTLTVRNNGPDTATGVVVADPLPGSVSFASVKTTQGTCTGGILIRCELGTMKSGSVVVITITVTPRQPGIVFNRATVVGNEAETTTANNTASTTTLVKGAFVPAAVVQHGCIAISVGTRSTTVGVHSKLTIHATELGKPAQGVKVRVHGAGVDRLSPRSDRHGTIRLTIVPRKAGIIRISVASRDACGTARIGVVGAFTPPVTG